MKKNMANVLVCPSSGEDCRFANYCSGLKDLLHERINERPLFKIMDIALPAEFVKAQKEYCTEKKLEILQTACDASHEPTTVVLAGLMIDNIIDNREKFRG